MFWDGPRREASADDPTVGSTYEKDVAKTENPEGWMAANAAQDPLWWLSDTDRQNLKEKGALITEIEAGQKDAAAQVADLASGRPIVDSAANRTIAGNQIGVLYRQQVSNAAARGLLHSGVMDSIQSQSALAQAQAGIGLIGGEEGQRRGRIQKLEQQQIAMKEAEAKIPTWAESDRTPGNEGRKPYVYKTEVLKDERARIQASRNELDQKLQLLQRTRLSEGDLKSRLNHEIDRVFQGALAEVVGRARQSGMSDDAIRGLQGQFAAQQEQAHALASVTARDLSGPDPNSVATALAAFYNPDTIAMHAEARNTISDRDITKTFATGMWNAVGSIASKGAFSNLGSATFG